MKIIFDDIYIINEKVGFGILIGVVLVIILITILLVFKELKK